MWNKFGLLTKNDEINWLGLLGVLLVGLVVVDPSPYTTINLALFLSYAAFRHYQEPKETSQIQSLSKEIKELRAEVGFMKMGREQIKKFSAFK